MEIKVTNLPYEQVRAIAPKEGRPAKKPNIFFRTLLKIASLPDLWAAKFTCERVGMENLPYDQPCIILMNHSSFIDVEIASSIFYPRPINIVTTWDGFIGKNWLMQQIGCMQTKKFTTGAKLLREIKHCLQTLKTSVLIYPEASYSFDGTATPLPESLGKFVKMFGVPVVTVITKGAFLRQPLYNELKKRKSVPVSAKMEYLLSPAEIGRMSVAEINATIGEKFSFDNFRTQREEGLVINDSFRADGLHRVLYKCPHCLAEGKTKGEGTMLTCTACGKQYELTELGAMRAVDGETEIDHIPDWYAWERKCVKEELEADAYALDIPVRIMMMQDSYHVYEIGEGRLTHGKGGFDLQSSDGQLTFHESATASYSVYSDFYWYQIADTICIGDLSVQYYCFPLDQSVPVAKVRLAAEELFKMLKSTKTKNTASQQ